MKEMMTVGSFLNFGVESTKKYFFKFIGIILFAIIVMAAAGYVAVELSETIGGIFLFIISILIGFGFVKNTINIVKGESIDFFAFFSANPITLINFFVGMIITGLIVSVGFILLIIPGIIFGYMLILVPYLIIDQNMGAFEAITKSMQLTKGYKMDIFAGHFISSIIIYLLSLLIITIPFTLTMALFIQIYPYLVLTGQLDKAQKEINSNAPAASEQIPEE